MLTNYLFYVLDIIVYPLFFFPKIVSLTAVSLLFGVILMGVYWATSDQWALAHYKAKLKEDQQKLLVGDYGWDTIKRLMKGNVTMGLYGFIPAVACIIVILIILPWLGNRFGYAVVEPMEPFEVKVKSDGPWSVKYPTSIRKSSETTRYSGGETTLRFLVDDSTQTRLQFTDNSGQTFELPLRNHYLDYPVWPHVTNSRWYHSIVNPAQVTLPSDHTVNYIRVGYSDLVPSLAFSFPGMGYVPGWMSWFFIVATASGFWAKFRWEIE